MEKKYSVKVISGENETIISAHYGEKLYDVLARSGVSLTAPCGGNGKCGKCLVKATGFIETNQDGYCLACKTYVQGDCTVYIEDTESKVLLSGCDETFETDGEEGYGLAVDIGTTTIAAYIIELSNGKIVKTFSTLNPQRIHGADVISRMEYASKNEGNAEILRNEITCMITEFCNSGYSIKMCVLVGNTVMMHLTAGYETATLSKAPFIPIYTQSHYCTISGVPGLLGGVVSGYVGADTLSAMLACNMDKKDETALLIDIGTNGEIVLKHNGEYLCCSCAAGPAFEGAHISCGTGAVAGAIDHLKKSPDGDISISTIGNRKPVGICGSGLIDAVALLVQDEIISPVGRMNAKYCLTENICITPEDIREVQLAKAAIGAGIQILISRFEIDFDEIDSVYLAGGFGNYIDIVNACKIGLLPAALMNKITLVGNAAGTGARMLLLSNNNRLRFEALRQKTKYIELSDQDEFEDFYADCLLFGEDC